MAPEVMIVSTPASTMVLHDVLPLTMMVRISAPSAPAAPASVAVSTPANMPPSMMLISTGMSQMPPSDVQRYDQVMTSPSSLLRPSHRLGLILAARTSALLKTKAT